MKLVATLAIAVLASLSVHVAPAVADGTCTTKNTCKKTLGCASGYTLIDLTEGLYVCRKATSEVQSASLKCSSGETMNYVNGTDVCTKAISVNPKCKNVVAETYSWDASKKACKRDSGADVWKSSNIRCKSGTAYDDDSGKCKGTSSRPVWSYYDPEASCEDILDDSAWAQDFSGNKDMCVTSSTEYSWKAPTLQ